MCTVTVIPWDLQMSCTPSAALTTSLSLSPSSSFPFLSELTTYSETLKILVCMTSQTIRSTSLSPPIKQLLFRILSVYACTLLSGLIDQCRSTKKSLYPSRTANSTTPGWRGPTSACTPSCRNDWAIYRPREHGCTAEYINRRSD